MSKQPYSNLDEEYTAAEQQHHQHEQQQQPQACQQPVQQQVVQQQQVWKQETPLQQPTLIQASPPHQDGHMQNTATHILPGHHITIQNGQPIFVPNKPKPGPYKISTKCITVMCIIMIVVASVGIVANISGIALHCETNCSAHAIWSGAMFIVAASFGIATARNRMIGLVITSMTLSILSSACAAAVIILASVGVYENIDYLNEYYWGHDYDWAEDEKETKTEAALGMDSVLVACGITNIIFSIILSIIFGKAVCARFSKSPGSLNQYQNAIQMTSVQGCQQTAIPSNQQQVAGQSNQSQQMAVQSNQGQQIQAYPIMIPHGTMQPGQVMQPIVITGGLPCYSSA